ncbi:MAG TPA: aminotransferase class I/II-fold pyridoxal phosphate-dependent enzyme [Blastocatellia bacterium]|nr:aminotransferase class I/II-fold pyridoxal phosphate-dependent enzyme [Blastocatellia bacterium]HMV82194.1 aminotransferase class I/II-fold pyridoxal phosphate-dependent enzyme [Blastocatellia bacterium]HMX24617.1 aminotransferase class I/II-fold pyridoxal phosphate-dependent enzyme [Blastocatellia bacterium]HMZ20207.1 aminotransferase class I/II-fold pyridoxal phosphate-dependent enzyme [Blastocatellia bacterium]HNG32062.1 aminotransferase class I/II-fold pyridoxal phosphate-dependent enzym
MKNSVYMTWAKYHAGARYNLANSGILGCDLNDLTITLEDVAVNGPNHEGFAPLKDMIAAKYGVTSEQVVTAQGTSMANFLAMATVIERGDEVLIEQPVYEPILAAANYLGAEVKRFSRRFENAFDIDLEELQSSITSRTRLIVITSPHNPSGVALGQQTLQRVGELAAGVGAQVLVDEVYRDILFEDADPVVARLGEQFITTGSLTKSYGLSGLRCGWILCAPALAERMRRLNDLFGAVGSVPSDTLSVAAFRQLDKLEARTRAMMEPNIKLVHGFLREHQDLLECVLPKRSMTVFPRLKHQADSQPLHDLLRQFETSIVPGTFFEAPEHFRLGFAVKTEDVETGLQYLSKALRLL